MNAREIVELIFSIIGALIVGASVVCIVWYGAEAIVDGVRTKKGKR